MIVRILVRQYSRLSDRASWRFMRVARFDDAERAIRDRIKAPPTREIPRRWVKREQRRALRWEW